MDKPTGPKYPRPLSLRLDDDLRDALEEAARREDRPVGMMARLLLREARKREGREEKALRFNRLLRISICNQYRRIHWRCAMDMKWLKLPPNWQHYIKQFQFPLGGAVS
jgi:hypothetical protein